MNTIAYFIGTVLAKILSVCGIGSFLNGLFLRNPMAVVGMSIVYSVIDIMLMMNVAPGGGSALGAIITPFVGIGCGFIGWWIRGRKQKPATE